MIYSTCSICERSRCPILSADSARATNMRAWVQKRPRPTARSLDSKDDLHYYAACCSAISGQRRSQNDFCRLHTIRTALGRSSGSAQRELPRDNDPRRAIKTILVQSEGNNQSGEHLQKLHYINTLTATVA